MWFAESTAGTPSRGLSVHIESADFDHGANGGLVSLVDHEHLLGTQFLAELGGDVEGDGDDAEAGEDPEAPRVLVHDPLGIAEAGGKDAKRAGDQVAVEVE